MMRLVYFFLMLASFLFGAQPSLWSACPNEGCKCTAENHCGCMDGKPCSCGKNAPSPRTNAPVACNDDGCGCTFASAPYPSYDMDYSYNNVDYGNNTACCDFNYDCDESNRYCCPNFLPVDDTAGWPCCITGSWMPEYRAIFRPFIADPREITYSVAWRYNDNALEKNVIAVSYYDNFPIYGWCNAWQCGDKLEIDLDGCLWAVFDPCTYSSPLINADYYVGFSINYGFQKTTHRIRVFHISSHVGDEFLLNHPHFDRRNPSAEYLDYFISYQWNNDLRMYGGLGVILEEDSSFEMGRFYAEGGVEARISSLGCLDNYNKIYKVPFFAAHFRYNEDFKNHLDSTYALGIEIGKTSGQQHRLRFYAEYHDGYSVEGQWSRKATNYFALKATYGY